MLKMLKKITKLVWQFPVMSWIGFLFLRFCFFMYEVGEGVVLPLPRIKYLFVQFLMTHNPFEWVNPGIVFYYDITKCFNEFLTHFNFVTCSGSLLSSNGIMELNAYTCLQILEMQTVAMTRVSQWSCSSFLFL